MKHYFHRVSAATPTRFWINNVTREQARLAVEEGAVGCTQNPSYTWKMLTSPEEKDFALAHLDRILAEHPDWPDDQVLADLQRQLVGNIARTYFMPLYEQTGGRLGYVSIQGDPFREDVQSIIEYALKNREAAPNIMAKVPVTEEGLKAIEYLAAAGVPINATEVMTVQQAMDVGAAYRNATKDVSTRAPIFFSHITGILDEYFHAAAARPDVSVDPDALWQAGIACAKKTYSYTKSKYPEMGFIGGGARGLHHFTEMVGADAHITINWAGTADELLRQDPVVVSRFLQPTPEPVVDALLRDLPDFDRAFLMGRIQKQEYEAFGPVVLFRSSFEKAWRSAREFITQYRAEGS